MNRRLPGDFELDDDPTRIEIDAVHDYLANESYWARGRARETVERLVREADRVLGLYHGGRQIGFARAVSDGVSVAYLADVYVLPEFRGRASGSSSSARWSSRAPSPGSAGSCTPETPTISMRNSASGHPGNGSWSGSRMARVPVLNYQDMIRALEGFWAERDCVLMQPYHTEVGAGTFNPATVLRCLGPKPWRTAYVEPSIRPTDGRYAENPFRFQQFWQYQVVLKPAPEDVLDIYFESLEAVGIELARHDVRLVEDDWEAPTLGGWGLGWEVWIDGMEVTQWTYFQQMGGFDLDLIPAEITYGLDRLAMFVQGKPSAFELEWAAGVTWGDVFRENERQWSHYNFEEAPVETLTRRFGEYEAEGRHLLERRLPLPAYDQVLKCSHAFNLLDARGAIAVTERAAYIARVRNLARDVCSLYLELETDAVAAA